MKVLIIGGNGTIGRRVAGSLPEAYTIVTAGRSSGDIQVDISDSSSIKNMFESLGKVDAIVCIAGEAKWAPLQEMSESDYYVGLKSKLMGQVNIVRIGMNYLDRQGSITLSTGILADDPVAMTTSAAMVNGALHSFVQAAALETTPGIRLNVVSLGVVEDAYEKYKDFFPGHNPITTEKVINAYRKSLLGKGHGEVIRVYE